MKKTVMQVAGAIFVIPGCVVSLSNLCSRVLAYDWGWNVRSAILVLILLIFDVLFAVVTIFRMLHPDLRVEFPVWIRLFRWWVAFVSYAVSCLVLIKITTAIFKKYRLYEFALNYNLLLSSVFVLVFLQFVLRKRVILRLSWKKVSSIWLGFTGVSAITVGGFGMFGGLIPQLKTEVVKMALDAEYVNPKLLVLVYIVTITVLGLAYLLSVLGRSISNNEDSNAPMGWFIPTFALVWIGNLGVFTLFFNCLFLTLQAYISA